MYGILDKEKMLTVRYNGVGDLNLQGLLGHHMLLLVPSYYKRFLNNIARCSMPA
jgi:hypothetical protein